MPGWGTGSFENEDAQNFLKALPSTLPEDMKRLLSRAADEADYSNTAESSIVIVAAEIVACARNAPPQNMPMEISDWICKVEGAPSAELIDLARRAVHKIRVNSELKDLWQEADGLNEWSAALRELEERLA